MNTYVNDRKTVPFVPADILIPKTGFEKWSIVACDQFTSEPQYWRDVTAYVGNEPSALKITLPEIYLSDDDVSDRISEINERMREYLSGDIFNEYKNSMIYVERTLPDGLVRRGIIGAIDLEQYDYAPGSNAVIRATEGTVIERIPPRVKIRRGAPLEIPHAMVLFDEPENTVIGPLTCKTGFDSGSELYSFKLMMGGGSVRGRILNDNEIAGVIDALYAIMEANQSENPMLFAVGDGNHSLAAARQCYLANPTEANRYALVEIINIHDTALEFEPIYRVLFNVDPANVIEELTAEDTSKSRAHSVSYVCASGEGEVRIGADSALAVGAVQDFIDRYLERHPDAMVDYIHGLEVARYLSREKESVGFIFEGMRKDELFPAVLKDGALPRKTFSMGEAQSKRYYLEARRIDPAEDF